MPIPHDDYIQQYQRNPDLWPVEFFLIVFRRILDNNNQPMTQLLVRPLANGTSKWGLGTGAPLTRWILSSSSSSSDRPPMGYQYRDLYFDARNFPEFPQHAESSWTYQKIDLCSHAFGNQDEASDFYDAQLTALAQDIQGALQRHVATVMPTTTTTESSPSLWESSCRALLEQVVQQDNCAAAIQGTLRMSGLFARKHDSNNNKNRHVDIDQINPTTLAASMRMYTMFPQMLCPLPLPSTSAQALQQEIATRPARLAQQGRNPHVDVQGRKFTHISTSNVSNTIHGIYLTLDATDLFLSYDVPPALDMFGTQQVPRKWVSLADLAVLDTQRRRLATHDPKPTFISGFIVRQLVKEGVIPIE